MDLLRMSLIVNVYMAAKTAEFAVATVIFVIYKE